MTQTAIKERPILFSAAMVRAILEGRKTQTRRIMKAQPMEDWRPYSYGELHKMEDDGPNPDKVIGWGPVNDDGLEGYKFPYGQPGDRLWVRETFSLDESCKGTIPYYRATDHESCGQPWKPAIHMPRWASRIMLEITNVEAQRLQSITQNEAEAEGMVPPLHPDGARKNVEKLKPGESCRGQYADLFDSINGNGTWQNNPWVWVISFKKLDATHPKSEAA